MNQSFVTTASSKPLSRVGSTITDCGGELSWVCQLAVPTVWWLLWGTADTKSKLDIPLGLGGGGGGGQWSQMTGA